MKFLIIFLGLYVSNSFALYQKIHFEVTKKDKSRFRRKEEKYIFSNPSVKIDDRAPIPIELKTRGSSCLGAYRRCFEIKFANPISWSFFNGKEVAVSEFKKIKLISMWEDQGHIHNKIGLTFLRESGVSFIPNSYVDVRLNDEILGLYMWAFDPTSWIRKQYNSPVIFRRDGEDNFYVKKSKISGEDLEEKIFAALEGIQSIFRSEGHLYEKLAEKMDIENYFKWLGINHLLKNGDYTDEIFFYVDQDFLKKGKIYFRVFAWDYDDIFKSPHQSRINDRYQAEISQSLLYSFESHFDRKIFNNSSLYHHYKQSYKKLLQDLTPQKISGIIQEVRGEISPYLDLPDLLELGKRDDYQMSYSTEFIEELLSKREKEILERRSHVLEKIL